MIPTARSRLFSARDAAIAPDAPRKLAASKSRIPDHTPVGFAFPRLPALALPSDDAHDTDDEPEERRESASPLMIEGDENVRDLCGPSDYTAHHQHRVADDRRMADAISAQPDRIHTAVYAAGPQFGAAFETRRQDLTPREMMSALLLKLANTDPMITLHIEFQDPQTGRWRVSTVSFMHDPPVGALFAYLVKRHALPWAGMSLYRAGLAMWNMLARLSAYGVADGETLRFQHSRMYIAHTDDREVFNVAVSYQMDGIAYFHMVLATSTMTVRTLFDRIADAVSTMGAPNAIYSVDPSRCETFDAVSLMYKHLHECKIEDGAVIEFKPRHPFH